MTQRILIAIMLCLLATAACEDSTDGVYQAPGITGTGGASATGGTEVADAGS